MDERREKTENPSFDAEYLSEQIKQRPVNRRKLLRRTLITGFLAILFGIVALLTFVFLYPVIERWINPREETPPVVLPEETVTEEMAPEDMIAKDEELYAQQPAEPETDAEAIEEAIEKVLSSKVVDEETVESMYGALRAVGQEAEASMVVVAGISDDRDWFNDLYETADKASGVIVAQTSKEVLVLCKNDILQDALRVQVTFHDGTMAQAEVKAVDSRLHVSVLSVNKESLPETMREELVAIPLGASSGTALIGKPVIAIGAPTGEIGSMSYGIVTATGQTIDLPDAAYKRITTDIYTGRGASGILIDLKGQFVAFTDLSYNDRLSPNLLSGIGITELRDTIELLSNGKERPYLGIHGVEVTDAIGEDLGVPRGVYVHVVEMDSPAMEVGIQSGDVITAVGETEITKYWELLTALDALEAVEEVSLTVMRQGAAGYTESEIKVILE